jgi:hypothetical protein
MKNVSLVFFTILALTCVSASKSKTPDLIIGKWKLGVIGYDSRGQMSMYMVVNTRYEFAADFSGRIVKNDSIVTAFSWIKKKNNLQLTETGVTHAYRVVSGGNPNDMTLVDKQAGTDTLRTYIPYEKGLIFSRITE